MGAYYTLLIMVVNASYLTSHQGSLLLSDLIFTTEGMVLLREGSAAEIQ